MSKSKGNVIDPIELIDKFGADALRFTLAAMAAQGRDIKLSTQRVEGYRNFATKLWNASRFAELNGCARVEGFDPSRAKAPLNRWILGEAARAVAETAQAIEAFRFNDAANAAYRFVWSVFCDWHLELAKPVLQGGADAELKIETQATIAHVLDVIYALLHPFMPFVTEELWAIKGAEGPSRSGPLALGPWPKGASTGDAAAEAEIGFVVELDFRDSLSTLRDGRRARGATPADFGQAERDHARNCSGLGRDNRSPCARRRDRIRRVATRRLGRLHGARRARRFAAGRRRRCRGQKARGWRKRSPRSAGRSPRSTQSLATLISLRARLKKSSRRTASGAKPRSRASRRWNRRCRGSGRSDLRTRKVAIAQQPKTKARTYRFQRDTAYFAP